MHPRFRSFLSPLLGVVLLLGHAPAWLHMGSAGGTCCRSGEGHRGGEAAHCDASAISRGDLHKVSGRPVSREKETAAQSNACCCHHHPSEQPTEQVEQLVEHGDAKSGSIRVSFPFHDSHHCWICQSITAPNGVSASPAAWLTSIPVECERVPTHDRVYLDETLFLPLSRGPPASRC